MALNTVFLRGLLTCYKVGLVLCNVLPVNLLTMSMTFVRPVDMKACRCARAQHRECGDSLIVFPSV